MPNVFVLGDLAHFEQDGHQVPGVAQPAMQMGDHVAKMIAADLAGKPRPPFHYFDKGDMATIGRMSAIAKVEWPFKAHMSGFPAWFTWVTIHIFFLIGFRNRLSVLANWAWTYFTFTRGARLITGDQIPSRLDGTNRSRPHASQGGDQSRRPELSEPSAARLDVASLSSSEIAAATEASAVAFRCLQPPLGACPILKLHAQRGISAWDQHCPDPTWTPRVIRRPRLPPKACPE